MLLEVVEDFATFHFLLCCVGSCHQKFSSPNRNASHWWTQMYESIITLNQPKKARRPWSISNIEQQQLHPLKRKTNIKLNHRHNSTSRSTTTECPARSPVKSSMSDNRYWWSINSNLQFIIIPLRMEGDLNCVIIAVAFVSPVVNVLRWAKVTAFMDGAYMRRNSRGYVLMQFEVWMVPFGVIWVFASFHRFHYA